MATTFTLVGFFGSGRLWPFTVDLATGEASGQPFQGVNW
jgi:hypothetical protein